MPDPRRSSATCELGGLGSSGDKVTPTVEAPRPAPTDRPGPAVLVDGDGAALAGPEADGFQATG